MADDEAQDEPSAEEIARRVQRGLRHALNMPHKPQLESSRKKRHPARKGRIHKSKSRR